MITNEVIVAYMQCKLKSYLLLFSGKKYIPHEYISILKQESTKNKTNHLSSLNIKHQKPITFSPEDIKKSPQILIEVSLIFDDLKTHADVLTTASNGAPQRKSGYEPTIVIGTNKISKDQKTELAFVGYVLSKIQRESPVSGTIVRCKNKPSVIKLGVLYLEIDRALGDLSNWIKDSKPKPPDIILNKNCSYCQFRKECEAKAIEKDDLSLLGRVTIKDRRKYHKKGIFTINQLSYLFKPRKQRIGKKKTRNILRYQLELQALAIRTNNIYVQELPQLIKHKVEIFLDIEGVPDQEFYYLIGLLICDGDKVNYHSFWADTLNEERIVWKGFFEEVNKYPDTPIYHYGGYDSKAINKLKLRYGDESNLICERLVNINSLIYAKIYFPVKSNSLKDLGKYLGVNWTHPKSSGLQSLIWRYYWEEGGDSKYQQILLTYNEEDCKALRSLTLELINIAETANSKWNVDFVDQPKKHTTEIGKIVHKELEQILESAHADYDKNKISTKLKSDKISEENGKKNKPRYIRKTPTPNKIIRTPARRKCTACSGALNITAETTEHTITDLVFTKNGCRKSIIKYIGKIAYCSKCKKNHSPKIIGDFHRRLFGHSIISWTIYQRIINRLPYRIIIQTMGDMFNIGISEATIINWMRYFAKYYTHTEKLLIRNILKSPIVHADETKINIQGDNHFVWVFTDGKHVVFKITETREAKIAHEFFANYEGVVISDFYPGYDSIKCRQQKCWVHLIRDINDDLWREPFNKEFEEFVLNLRRLIVPILHTIQKYGLKIRHLNKFKKSIDKFFRDSVDSVTYTFDVTKKYQKRLKRHKDSLFIFMTEDDIPWHNNMAERAIRQLAVQRKISGCFYKHAVPSYLLLLAISQTCRFQNKPFLKFLISGKKNIDLFKAPKRQSHSELVSKYSK